MNGESALCGVAIWLHLCCLIVFSWPVNASLMLQCWTFDELFEINVCACYSLHIWMTYTGYMMRCLPAYTSLPVRPTTYLQDNVPYLSSTSLPLGGTSFGAFYYASTILRDWKKVCLLVSLQTHTLKTARWWKHRTCGHSYACACGHIVTVWQLCWAARYIWKWLLRTVKSVN